MVKCAHNECNKKVPLGLNFPCKCEKVFCSKHRNFNDHSCTFDYQQHGKELLEKNNPVVVASKVDQLTSI